MSLLTSFRKRLPVRTEEQKQITLMLATGFFMGFFIAVYQVTVDSLFLNRMGEYLDKAFLVAGVLGILTTSLFSFFQTLVKFTTLALISVTLILLFTIAAYFLLQYESKWNDYFIFAGYAMTGPITAVLLLSYWGTFGRLFNFRQSKRIIGWIDTGQLIAAIAATLVFIPLTSAFVPDTSKYLLFCAGSIAIVCVLLFKIANSFKLAKDNPRETGASLRKETRLVKLFGDQYIRLLSFFILISMITFVLTQYSFQELVKVQYPQERDLRNFTSFFMGAVYGISLIMQTFVNQKILTNYGIRVALMILPVVMVIFGLLSIFTGAVFGYDKELAPNAFIYFFLFVALNRLLNWTLRDSLETPLFKLFFIPMEGRVRFTVQSKIEGIVNESARFIGGLLIFSLAFIPFFEIAHIGLIVLLGLAYFSLINKLYFGYRQKIRLKLEGAENQLDKLEKGFKRLESKLESMLTKNENGKAVFSYRLLEKINAPKISSWLNILIKNDDEATRHYAQEKINELKGLSVSDRYVIRIDDKKVNTEKKILSKLDLKLILDTGGEVNKARIQQLTRSSNADDRHYAAELLLHTHEDDCIAFLTELLFDAEPKVRNTAIRTSVKKHNPEVINSVINNLGTPAYSYQALHALIQIGENTLQALDAAFYRSGQSTQLMLRIIQVIGKIGGQRAKEILWAKMDYPNKLIVSQVLLSLGECGFKANVSQITRIKYAIESDIADISWNLSAIQEIDDVGFAEDIKEALRWEIKHDIEHIYMLLTMLYDTRSIQLVKENIDSGTPEGITYAIELLDVFLSDQLKQRVIPILDDLSDSERSKRLEYFYPRVKLSPTLVLKFLINRDFTQSNRWTKACVLFQIGLRKIDDFKLDLIAQLFNPDPLVREVAAWALHQINPEDYETNTARLGHLRKRELDQCITRSRKMTRFEKVLFFQKIDLFKNLSGDILSYLADICEEIRLKEGYSMVLDEKANNHFIILVSGTMDVYQKGERSGQYHEGQFIGEMLASNQFVHTNVLITRSECVLIKCDKEQFYDLLSDQVMLADRVVEVI